MNNYLPTDYQAFIHTSRYARWLDDEGRRETWPETVTRYMNNVVRKSTQIPYKHTSCTIHTHTPYKRTSCTTHTHT